MLWREKQEGRNRWAMEIRIGTVRDDLELLVVETWVVVQC